MADREAFARVNRERLSPTIGNASYLGRRHLRVDVAKFVELLVREHLKTVLDVGCGTQPYRTLMKEQGLRYVGCDPSAGVLPDIAASAGALPFTDQSLDAVLCTQVLQEADDPRQAVSEILRVLRPGGRVLLTAPGAYVAYSPRDRWRWSAAGLAEAFADYDQVRVEAQGGAVQACCQLGCRVLNKLAKLHPILTPLRLIGVPALNLIGPILDRWLFWDGLTTNYAVFAKKATDRDRVSA